MTPPGPRLPDLSVLFPFRAWLHHPALRSWTTWLFVALVAVPPLAFVLFPRRSDLLGVAIVFATYFAVAWFLVLWVVVRPARVTVSLVAQVAAAEVVAFLLYLSALPAGDADLLDNLLLSISAVGFPEELVKALPVVAVVVLNRRLSLAPRDVLFLAATSGLVFGAMEAVHYTVNIDYSTTPDAMILVWRFVTDPIAHALWAGVAGYFVGIAVSYRYPGPWLALTGMGIGVPAVLHGLNDWDPINLGLLWPVVQIVSALLFLAYARIGLVPARPAGPGTPPLAPAGLADRPVVVDPPTAPIAMPQHSSGRHALV